MTDAAYVPEDVPEDWEPEGMTEPGDEDYVLPGDAHDDRNVKEDPNG